MTRIDTNALADVINQCLENSTDLGFTPEQRAEFFKTGERLRPQLTKLLSAQFNDGTTQISDLNHQISALNAELRASAANLSQTATTLNNVARLVGTIDGLLSLAV